MIRKIVLTIEPGDDEPTRVARDVAAMLRRACDADLVVLDALPQISPRTAFDPDLAARPACGEQARTRSVLVRGGGDDLRRAVHHEQPDLVLVHDASRTARRLLRRDATRNVDGLSPAALMSVRLTHGDRTPPPPHPEPQGLARLRDLVLGYYRDRLAWAALAATTLMLCYLGGAALFWVHAIYLDEPGPRIRPVLHYALDATAGLIGLTPPLALILPLAVWAARDRAGTAGVRPLRYALVGGGVFTLVTTGGPFAHDSLVARGTFIANHVTRLVGTAGAPAGPGTDIPLVESMAAQLVVGLPVYVLLMFVSLHLVRAATHRWHAHHGNPHRQPA